MTLPFFSVDPDEGIVTCAFCPSLRVKFNSKERSSMGFRNTKTSLERHCLSTSHIANACVKFRETNEKAVCAQETAGMNVLQCVYGGLKECHSFRHIQRDIALLHTRKVKVGNINHSKGTIDKMKKVIYPCRKRDRPNKPRFPTLL